MDIIPTHEQTNSLAALVRGGSLTPAQRDQAALVLGMIGSALRTVANADERYPDDPTSAAVYVAGAWEPVATEYARLLTATLDERGVRPPAHAGGLAGSGG